MNEDQLAALALKNYRDLVEVTEHNIEQATGQLAYDKFIRDAVAFAVKFHEVEHRGEKLRHMIGRCVPEIVGTHTAGRWVCPPDCPVEARGW